MPASDARPAGAPVPPPRRPLRCAVVGLGFGRCHARELARMDGAELVAVAELDPAAQGLDLVGFSASLGARGHRDGLRLIAEEELDAVVLAVPPRAREKLIRAAGDAGLALFLEKPFAADRRHAEALARLCSGYPASPVMLDFCLRHLPAVARLRELLAGPLGRPLVVNADLMLPRDDSPGWVGDPADGNGVVNENTCHLFDTLGFLLGEPETVHAEGGAYRGGRLEDGIAVAIGYAGGAAAVLTGGSLGVPALRTPAALTVHAERGQARLTGRDHMFTALEWATAEHTEAVRESWEPLGRGRIASAALRHFVRSVSAGTAPEPGVRDGIGAVGLAMAVRTSLETGGRVPLTRRGGTP
ncbi:Gfo/Idh/MocA family oxidoreductase [Streptomyces tubbatahanensis]|uniref:Gfo/Idh/MocA family oxidoreductase n=1 Tax=Streptomyces tubbatahanensis TaxID=2923272 RepID=A0ABY3Y0X0_9ACTN|nr:Gfo/Idh/MocA family oxidoreductase [Streptomyces tubbatahanensis]UNT00311.1 Gfo/Idh/MocA family oxidoreductase [Streptomyces tubbatahanensis]